MAPDTTSDFATAACLNWTNRHNHFENVKVESCLTKLNDEISLHPLPAPRPLCGDYSMQCQELREHRGGE